MVVVSRQYQYFVFQVAAFEEAQHVGGGYLEDGFFHGHSDAGAEYLARFALVGGCLEVVQRQAADRLGHVWFDETKVGRGGFFIQVQIRAVAHGTPHRGEVFLNLQDSQCAVLCRNSLFVDKLRAAAAIAAPCGHTAEYEDQFPFYVEIFIVVARRIAEAIACKNHFACKNRRIVIRHGHGKVRALYPGFAIDFELCGNQGVGVKAIGHLVTIFGHFSQSEATEVVFDIGRCLLQALRGSVAPFHLRPGDDVEVLLEVFCRDGGSEFLRIFFFGRLRPGGDAHSR